RCRVLAPLFFTPTARMVDGCGVEACRGNPGFQAVQDALVDSGGNLGEGEEALRPAIDLLVRSGADPAASPARSPRHPCTGFEGPPTPTDCVSECGPAGGGTQDEYVPDRLDLLPDQHGHPRAAGHYLVVVAGRLDEDVGDIPSLLVVDNHPPVALPYPQPAV